MAAQRDKNGKFLKGNSVSPKQLGNKNNQKLKTAQLRMEAYKQYCEHIASGLPKESWVFDHPELSLTERSMRKYLRDYADEFPSIQKEIAEAKRYGVWIEKGMDMMVGKIEKCQPAIFQMFMRNMFGWDKEGREVGETTEPLIKQFANFLRG